MESYFKALSNALHLMPARFDHRSVKLVTMSFAMFFAGEVSNPVTRRSGAKMAIVWMLMVALAMDRQQHSPMGGAFAAMRPSLAAYSSRKTSAAQWTTYLRRRRNAATPPTSTRAALSSQAATMLAVRTLPATASAAICKIVQLPPQIAAFVKDWI